MRVIIVGGGDIGRELAKNLVRRGSDELIIIEVDEKRCEQLAGELDALILRGDGTNPEMLQKARVAEADALVAATGSDALNTVIVMLGHRFGVKKIIVKLNEFGLRAACQEIGVSKIIAPKIAASAEILAALYGLDRLDFSLVVHGGLRLVELDAGGALGTPIADLEKPDNVVIVALIRGQQALLPLPHTKLKEGDVLLTLVENETALEKMKKQLVPPAT